MTMHLVGPYLTTTNYSKKKKSKPTAKLEKALAEHDSFLKKMGVGKAKSGKQSTQIGLPEKPNLRVKPNAVLSNEVAANGSKKEEKKYTGSEIAGIVVTHKSNLMPVRRDNPKAAIDASTMRRS